MIGGVEGNGDEPTLSSDKLFRATRRELTKGLVIA